MASPTLDPRDLRIDDSDPPEAATKDVAPPESEQSPEASKPIPFYQQVNIGQMPPRIWNTLSPDQAVDLSKTVLSHSSILDERRFKFAMEAEMRKSDDKRRSTIIAGTVAACGFGLCGYLAANGPELQAGMVLTFLGTIISVVILFLFPVEWPACVAPQAARGA